MNKYFCYITIFITGFVLLTIEILGARMISPFFGVSLYVWASLISVTLVGLAIGYWLGGKLGDKQEKPDLLYLLIMGAGVYLILVPHIKGPILIFLGRLGLRMGALISSAILFAVPIVLLGTITPFILKFQAKQLNNVASTAGNLYSISTIGSFMGCLTVGFFLIPNFSINRILFLMVIPLFLISLLYWIMRKKILSITAVLILIAVSMVGVIAKESLAQEGKFKVVYKAQSYYGEIKVVDIKNVRLLLINNLVHTGIEKNKGYGIFAFQFIMQKALHVYHPKAKNALVLGLGGGALINSLEQAGVDVESVEISPEIAQVAKKYFGLRNDSSIHIADARYFIRNCNKKYDAIFIDVFQSLYVPAHLSTQEFFKELKEKLNPSGVVIINFIGGLEKEELILAKSFYKTLLSVFPHVRFFISGRKDESRNIIFIASERELQRRKDVSFTAPQHLRIDLNEESFDNLEENIIFTDNYNPIEEMKSNTVNEYIKKQLEYFPEEILE